VVIVKPDEQLPEFAASSEPADTVVVTGMLEELVRICSRHVLDPSETAIIREPYVPFLPERGSSGKWTRATSGMAR